MKTKFTIIILIMLSFSVVAFSQAGTLDSSFGSYGKATLYLTKFTPSKFDRAIALQQNGKIVIAGSSGTGAASDMAIVRFQSNGSIDKSFGIDGKAIADFGGWSYGNAIAIQSNGKIIVAGTENSSMNSSDIVLARFNSDGSLDSSFGGLGYGRVWTDISLQDAAHCIAILANGKILVGGTDGTFFVLVRYNTDGSLDKNFGSGGVVKTDATSSPDKSGISYANSLAIQANGKILLAGNAYDEDPANDFAIVRYQSNGEADKTFGINGQVHPLITLADDVCNSASVLSNGEIIAGGFSEGGSETYGKDFVLIKLQHTGALDSSFGTNGVLFTDIDRSNDYAHSLAVQPDGKIIIGGYLYDGLSQNLALARFKQNGKLDASFGKNGKVITDFNHHADSAYSLAIQPNGKILLSGTSADKFVLVRYKGGDELTANFDGNSSLLKNKKPFDEAGTFNIYPNPVHSAVNAEFNGANTKIKTINIYDVKSMLLITKDFKVNTQIDLRQLIAGTYLIKINDETGKALYNGKIIKQ